MIMSNILEIDDIKYLIFPLLTFFDRFILARCSKASYKMVCDEKLYWNHLLALAHKFDPTLKFVNRFQEFSRFSNVYFNLKSYQMKMTLMTYSFEYISSNDITVDMIKNNQMVIKDHKIEILGDRIKSGIYIEIVMYLKPEFASKFRTKVAEVSCQYKLFGTGNHTGLVNDELIEIVDEFKNKFSFKIHDLDSTICTFQLISMEVKTDIFMQLLQDQFFRMRKIRL